MVTTSQKIRVLILTDSLLHLAGGSETHICNLIRELDEDRYSVDVIQLGFDSESAYVEPDLGGACRSLIRVPIAKVYSPFGIARARRIWRIIEEQRYDIVQSYHEKSDLISAFMPERIAGRLIRVSSRRDMGFKRSAAVRLVSYWLDRRFDAFVAPSKAIIEQLGARKELSGIPLIHIANGVDVDKFGVEDPAASIDRSEDSDVVRIACVANLNPIKGHSVLLRALASVTPQANVHLALAGGGPLEASLKGIARELGIADRVSFLGVIDNVRTLLNRSDVMVLPSLSEGMSNALLEGLASGLPIVATRVGGNPELVEPGVNGELVEPGDEQALATALLKVVQDAGLRATYGDASRSRAQKRYSVDAMARAFDGIYDRLLTNQEAVSV